jgi:hypothetical protein
MATFNQRKNPNASDLTGARDIKRAFCGRRAADYAVGLLRRNRATRDGPR